MTFAVKAKPKPGSVLGDGSIVDYKGRLCSDGPCFVPRDLGISLLRKDYVSGSRRVARFQAASAAGWRNVPAKDWPSVLPEEGLMCIARSSGR